MHTLYSFIFTLLLLAVVPTAHAEFVITGTVNGGDITKATSRENALQVPYSKPIYVQGSVVNTNDYKVHLVKITVKPNLSGFPELSYDADSHIGPGQTRSEERTVTFSEMVEKYVPSFLSWLLDNTTAEVRVRAYQQGSGKPVAERVIWIHVSDKVEVVPQSAIEAVGRSPVAMAGTATAAISAIGGAAHAMNVRKKRKAGGKGRGVKGSLLAAAGMSIGTALTLLVIGAIGPEEFFQLDALEAGLSAGLISFFLMMAAAL